MFTVYLCLHYFHSIPFGTHNCLLLHLTELSLKTSNFSLVFKHHSSTHLFLKAKMFPIMILTLTRDIQQLKYTSTNPRKKT